MSISQQKCCGLVYIEKFSYKYLRYSELNLHLTVSTSVAIYATTFMHPAPFVSVMLLFVHDRAAIFTA